MSSYPLVRWRMPAIERQDWDAPDLQAPWAVVVGMRRLKVERPGLVDAVPSAVTERGPLSAGELDPDGVRRTRIRALSRES